MNRATMKRDRENQKRLLQELELLSNDNSISQHHNLYAHALDDPPLFAGVPLFSTSDLSTITETSSEENALMVDFVETSHNPLIDEHPCDEPESQQLQVDHNGARVLQPPLATSWLSINDHADAGTCVSVSPSPSHVVKKEAVSPACVAAAATAAMIVVSHDHSTKRPRSEIQEHSVEGEASEEDCTTEASLEEREDPISPRCISDFLKDRSPQIEGLPCKQESLPAIQKLPKSPPPSRSVKTVQLHPARRLQTEAEDRRVITLSLDSSRYAEVCRKRRAEAMERFRRKKAVRSFGRKVRYQIRKRIATTRPRVNGRFARRSDAEGQAVKAGGKN